LSIFVQNSKNIFVLLLILTTISIQAQRVGKNIILPSDSIVRKKPAFDNNTVLIGNTKSALLLDTFKLKPFKPDPLKVVWMAAILPGYGQIMNKKYWKIPIVYGGFLGCAYAIVWNSSTYQSYFTAYKDIISDDPSATSYLKLIPKGYTLADLGGKSGFTAKINTAQQSYRRYRDLSVIATIGFYALTIVDAYVDAQLYDFDISPNLSMRIQPRLIQTGTSFQGTLAMQCSISFK
jgi:hypothetical protein